jgi:hypothetical protein
VLSGSQLQYRKKNPAPLPTAYSKTYTDDPGMETLAPSSAAVDTQISIRKGQFKYLD